MDVSLFGPIYDSKAVPEIKVWVIKQTTCTLMEFLQITKTLQRLSKKTLLEQNLSILFKINTYFKIYHWERTFGSVTNQHFTLISRDTGSFICPRKNQGKIISSSSKIPSTKWTSAYQPWDNPPKSSGG